MEVNSAFLVITLLTWAAVSVSGTTPELSMTTGDTVNISCFSGEGTFHGILIKWYYMYNDSTGHRMILKLVNGDLIKGAEYENRASLTDDFSMLILKNLTVADEGTYHCVVNTLKQTAVSNIKTKLNVFSLRPDTLPVVSPCTRVDKPAHCSIHANQSFTLTCTLPNVYPVEDTELTWYQDRNPLSSIHDVTQNDDATTDISRQIQISQTGYFTCNAIYLSANGRENTAVLVEAWIISPSDVPHTPGKNMTGGQIAGMIIGIVLLVGIFQAIIARLLHLSITRGRSSFRIDENELEEAILNQVDSLGSLPSSTVSRLNVNSTDPVTPSSLDILERFIRSGLHPKGDKRVQWPHKKTVVYLIDYSDNSKEIVIKHNDHYPKFAEEILIEYINIKLDKTKIKCITIYLDYSSSTQCSGMLQLLKKEIPDLQIKFSAFYYIRRPSCTVSCRCFTREPESFKMLRKLDARPFQKDDWDNLINLLRKDDEEKGHPTSDLHGLRYGDKYGVWRNEEDEKMRADYAALIEMAKQGNYG